MKFNLLIAIGKLIESFIDAVGLVSFIVGAITLGLLVAIFVPIIVGHYI